MKMKGQQSLNGRTPKHHIITIIISLQLEHPLNNEPRLLGCDLFHAIVVRLLQKRTSPWLHK